MFFVGIYFCFKNISQSSLFLRITRILLVLILSSLIGAAWIMGSPDRFNPSASCIRNIATKNIFTGSTKIYHCSTPPWYMTTVADNEAKVIFDNPATDSDWRK